MFKVNSGGPEPFEHEMNHSYMYPSFRTLRQFFVVFTEPSVAAQPPQGAFHNPSAGQHLKAMAVFSAFDHRNQPASQGESPLHQLSCVSAIGPNQLESGKSPQKLAQHQLGPISVLDVGPPQADEPLPPAAVPGYPPQYDASDHSPSCQRHSHEAPLFCGLHALAVDNGC